MNMQPSTSTGLTSVGQPGVGTLEAARAVVEVDFVVNGTPRRLSVDGAPTLLDGLREHLYRALGGGWDTVSSPR